jgi:hypothetical protein
MNTKTRIDNLWEQFRKAIDAAYADADKKREENGQCLRDYARDISWSDNLAGLLRRETANEKQHRSGRPSVPGFSSETASKLVLMNQVGCGALLQTMPNATEFLVFRQTAAEARVIGFLVKKFLTVDWRVGLAELDYAKLMQPQRDAA